MTENQKLREALQKAKEALSLALSDVDWRKGSPTQPVIYKAYNCVDEALALPTAAPVGDLPELPEPAAWRTPDEWPVCYQYTHEEPDAERIQWAARYGRKHEQVFTADQMRAYARAVLSAGDTVDAQRYRWLKGRSQVCLNQVWIGGYTTRQRDSDFLSKEDALSAIDTAIDEAMRKGQL